jgi:hypothetical protein
MLRAKQSPAKLVSRLAAGELEKRSDLRIALLGLAGARLRTFSMDGGLITSA